MRSWLALQLARLGPFTATGGQLRALTRLAGQLRQRYRNALAEVAELAEARGFAMALQPGRPGRQWLGLETLEARVLLAAVAWDGGGDSTSWNDPLNWDNNTLPTAADDVAITVAVPSFVAIDQAVSILSLTASQPIRLSAGTLTVAATSQTSGSFTMTDGVLEGAGNLTVSGGLSWSGGTMQGSGEIIVAAAGTLEISGAPTLARTLRHAGTGSIAAAPLFMALSAQQVGVIENEGSLTLLEGMNFQGYQGFAHVLNNSGTLIKSGSGDSTVSFVPLNNSGLVQIEQGSLTLWGAGTHSGQFALAAGSELAIGATQTFTDQAQISGDGSLRVNNGVNVYPRSWSTAGGVIMEGWNTNVSLTIGGSLEAGSVTVTAGTLNLSSGATVQNLTQSNGVIDGAGDITVSQQLAWSGGRIRGAGELLLPAGASGLLTRTPVLDRTLRNATNLTIGNGDAAFHRLTLPTSEAFLDNQAGASITLVNDAGFDGLFLGGPRVENDGTFTKTGPGDSYLVGVSIFNRGLVDVQEGTIVFNAGGTHSGAWQVAPGAELQLGGVHTFTAASTVTGGGALAVAGGSHTYAGTLDQVSALNIRDGGEITFDGSVNVPTILLDNGDGTFNGPTQTTNLVQQQSATLGGSGDVTVTNSLTWSGGFMSGTGRTTVAAGATMTVSGLTQLSRTLRNEGTGTLLGPSSLYAAQGQLENVGTLTKSGPDDMTITGSNALSNSGTLTVSQGGLILDSQSALDTGQRLASSAGATLQLFGNLTSTLSNPAQFDMQGTLQFFRTLSGNQVTSDMEALSSDLGNVAGSFTGNFALGAIRLDSGKTVRLVDTGDNAAGAGPEAVYVDQLIVPATATLDLNGLNLYARGVEINGTVINGTVNQLIEGDGGRIETNLYYSGQVATAGETDAWTFYGRTGRGVTVLLHPGEATLPAPEPPMLEQAQVELLAPSGLLLESAISTEQTSGAELRLFVLPLPEEGLYTIRVRGGDGQATGGYLVAAFDASVDTVPLILNQRRSGVIETPYAVDRWEFNALAGMQLQFDWLSAASADLLFTLTGPDQTALFTDLIADSGLLDLTASGRYTLEVRSGGQSAGAYSFQMMQTPQAVVLGTPYAGTHTGDSGQYFQFTLAEPGPLRITLADALAGRGNELYLKQGAPPTLLDYDLRRTGNGNEELSVLISHAAAGDWYLMVRGNGAPADGQIILTTTATAAFLDRVLPAQHGAEPMTLTVYGSGFPQGMQVRLRDGQGTFYDAASVIVDNPTQARAVFDLSVVPQGSYDVQVTQSQWQSNLLAGVFEVLPAAQAQFQSRMGISGQLVRRSPSTMQLEYANVGNATMAAPLVIFGSTSTANELERPLFFMGSRSLLQTFWLASERPPGVDNRVFFLASGAQPGVLNPGEQVSLPIYYRGMEEPLNSGPGFLTVGARYWTADDTTPIDWAARKENLRPITISSDAWDAIYANLISDIGSTGQYVQMISANAQYLATLGENVNELDQLWQFEIWQASGLSAVNVLESAVDAAVTAPGPDLALARQFHSDLVSRHVLGPLGQGWIVPWETQLLRDAGNNQIAIVAPQGAARIFVRDTRSSLYFSQSGDTAVLGAVGDGSYELREVNGDVTRFNLEDRIEYFQDFHGNRITYSYDDDGNMTALTHSAGAAINLAYNAAGRIISAADSLGRVTSYSYDASNRYLLTVTPATGNATTYTYDTSNTLATRHALLSSASGGVTRAMAYDARGRLSSLGFVDGPQATTFTYNDTAVVTVTSAAGVSELHFDRGRQVSRLVNALGQVTTALTERGRPTSVGLANGDELGYSYTPQGLVRGYRNELNRSEFVLYDPTFNRPTFAGNGNTFSAFSYDPQGNLLQINYGDGTRELFADYLASGEPQSYTARSGRETEFQYDSSGLIIRQTFADDSFVAFTRDTTGRVTSVSDGVATTTYTYGQGVAADALTSVTYPDGRSLSFALDEYGRRISLSDQDGVVSRYQYDQAGRLAQVRDGADNLTAGYSYGQAGALARIDRGNGSYSVYQHNAVGQVSSLINYGPDDAVHSSFTYSYDELGRTTRMITVQGQWNYDYDATGQLTGADFSSNDTEAAPNQSLLYSYDLGGNRTTEVVNNVTASYVSNDLNLYTSVDGAAHTYDADGNLTFDGTNTYTWNVRGLLSSVDDGVRHTDYEYDALGNLLARVVDGQRTEYLIDPAGLGNVVAEYGPQGESTRYRYGLGLLSADENQGDRAYYEFDALGSTSGVSGAAGEVVGRYGYLPFGAAHFASGPQQSFGYVGQLGVRSEPGGLHYMRARFTHDDLGRFISPDPVGYAGGDFNFVRYVNNSPTNLVDPRGLLLDRGATNRIIDGYLDANNGNAKAAWEAARGERTQHNPTDENLAAAEHYLWGISERQAAENAAGILGELAADAASFVLPVGYQGLKALSEASHFYFNTGANASPLSFDQFYYGAAGYLGELPPQPRPDNPNDSNRGPGGGPGGGPGSDGGSQDSAMEVRASYDPNDKHGAAGFGPQAWIAAGTPIPYRINFENIGPASVDDNGDPFPFVATAAAQRVTVSDQLPAELDWDSFRITGMGFGQTFFEVPADSTQFSGVVSMTDGEQTFDVQVEAGINAEDGSVFASFTAIDPLTGLPPEGEAGFLAPEDGTGAGKGFLTFVANPVAGLPSGTEIRNVALISFDGQAIIATNQINPLDAAAGTSPNKEALNTLDGVPPSSQVAALPQESLPTFTVSWAGEDDADGSGIASYSVYVAQDGGAFTSWLADTALTQADFTGVAGSTYAFLSVARDNVGLRQAMPTAAQAQTRVAEEEPTPSPVDLLAAIGRITLPTTLVPGDRGAIEVVVTNQGTARALGAIDLRVYASTEADLDRESAVLLGRLENARVALRPGQSRTFRLQAAVGQNLPLGSYFLIADVDPDNSFAESDTDNNVARSTDAYDMVWQFGAIDGRRPVRLTLADDEGVPVTFQLTGAGQGEVVEADGLWQIVVSGSSATTSLTVQPRGRGVQVEIGAVTVDGPLRLFNAGAVIATGQVLLGGDVGQMTVGQLQDADLEIDGVLKALRVGQWQGGSLQATALGRLDVTGNLDDVEVNLTRLLDADNARLQTLGQVNVRGWIDSSTLRSAGHVGSVTAGGMVDSQLFAGVEADVVGLPGSSADFADQATLGRLSLRGVRGDDRASLISSTIAAWSIGTAQLRTVEPEADEDFGFATGNIRLFQAELPDAGRVNLRNLDNLDEDVLSEGHFRLRLLQD